MVSRATPRAAVTPAQARGRGRGLFDWPHPAPLLCHQCGRGHVRRERETRHPEDGEKRGGGEGEERGGGDGEESERGREALSSVRVSEGLKKSVEKERLFLSDVNLCQSGEEASRRGVVEREQDEAETERATDRTVEVTRRTCWRRERLSG